MNQLAIVETARLLVVDEDDLSQIVYLYSGCLGIPALISKMTPATETDCQLIVELCQTQKITHLIFTSVGTQNKLEYPKRLAFLRALCSEVRRQCLTIQLILITGAEREDIAEAEEIFDRIFHIDIRAVEKITEFLKGLKNP